MNPKIFKTYDIRGKVGVELSTQDATLIGWALGTHLQRHYQVRQALIGYDMRVSSQDLQTSLMAGLHAAGCDTHDIGLVSTPVLYWSAFRTGLAGVMITASHLGKEYNGFKLVVGRQAIYGDEIQDLYRLVDVSDFDSGPGRRFQMVDVNHAYLNYLASCYRPVAKKLQVVVDAGNGMGGIYAPELLKRLGHQVTPLYCDLDGEFPNHHPNPEKAANVADLAAKVRELGADVGLAFDGDADRVGVVDETGTLISADKVMAWLATDIIPRNPGATFVGDVLSSQVVFDVVEQHGGRSVLWQSGHARVKSKMQAESAILGGESSGHMFFGDRYLGFDDGVYAAGRVVELLAERDEPLSQQLAALPRMFTTPEYRPHCPEEQKALIIEGVKAQLGDVPLVDVDGLRVLFPNGWGLLRPSGTEPVLSLRFEARTEADAWNYKNHLVGLLKTVYPDIEDF
ncbi:MAG: phosphomannomutase/phosphoglucomutase [Anaerolineales bacterium]|nr:phosphomannomutase/phosphoglucomutase [Anaerolineales bacterium]